MSRLLTLTLLGLVLAPGTFAQSIRLLPSAPGDLSGFDAELGVAGTAVVAPLTAGIERQPLHYSRPLEPDARLEARPAPAVSRSRSYSFAARGSELAAGVAIHATAPGALVRLQPLLPAEWHEEVAIDPANLTVISPAGETFEQGAGMELLVGAEKLRAADTPFPAGTTAFRLRPELGAGTFTIRADGLEGVESRFRVHVFDVESTLELALTTGTPIYLDGQTMAVTAALEGLPSAVATAVDGRLDTGREAGGRLEFERDSKGLWIARATATTGAQPPAGLHEAAVTARGRAGGHAFVRDARIPFGVAIPAARLRGDAEVDRSAGLTIGLGIEAALEGRYEARAVLFGTDPAGHLRPAGIAHAAAWLDPGSGRLELRFGPGPSGRFTAPFELRDLQLIDQGRMAILHRQARALVIAE